MNFIIYKKSKAQRQKEERKAERRVVVKAAMDAEGRRRVKADLEKKFGSKAPAQIMKG